MSTAHNIPNTAQAPDTDSSSPLAPKSSGKVSQSSASSTDSHVDALAASAKRQVANASAVAQEAVSSGAWAYPLYGVGYMLSHPGLLGPVLPLLLRSLLISAGVVAAVFFVGYVPTVGVLAFLTGPLAFIAAIPVLLGVAGAILLVLGKTFLIGPLGTDLFDAVMVQKGYAELVKKGRPITQSGRGTQLGKLLKQPFSKFSTDNIVRYFLTLPLNFIPVVGTVVFLGYNGFKSGPSYHARYFQLKGFDKDRRATFIERRRGAYTAFGTTAVLLQSIPVVSIVLDLASHIGAALWAAKIEGKDVGQAQEVEVSLPARS